MLRPWSNSIPPTYSTIKFPPPIRSARRRSPRRGGAPPARRARFRADQPTVGTSVSVLGAAAETASRRSRRGEAAFLAGAGLALFDQILRVDPPFAGALRQRLALRAATACAATGAASRGRFRAARRRTSFAPRRRERTPAPPGASIACGACSPRAQCGSTRRRCAPPPIFWTFRTT